MGKIKMSLKERIEKEKNKLSKYNSYELAWKYKVFESKKKSKLEKRFNEKLILNH
jgi:hypothetical protein